MNEIPPDLPVPDTRRIPPQVLTLAGRPYVLVPKSDFDRLRLKADSPGEDASWLIEDSVGSNLRARRHLAGLTLAVVADRAGIRLETLSRIENGRTDPSVRTVRSILKALDSPS